MKGVGWIGTFNPSATNLYEEREQVKEEEAKRKREEEESIEEAKIRQKTGYYFAPNKSEEWAVEFIAKSSPVMHPKEEDR